MLSSNINFKSLSDHIKLIKFLSFQMLNTMSSFMEDHVLKTLYYSYSIYNYIDEMVNPMFHSINTFSRLWQNDTIRKTMLLVRIFCQLVSYCWFV